jgi:hypothetical protein
VARPVTAPCEDAAVRSRLRRTRPPFATALVALVALVAALPRPAAAAPAAAADDPPPPARPNALQLDLGLAVVGLAYERIFHPRFATQLEAHVFGTWFGPIFDQPNVRGFGGQVRPSFFLTDDAPRGVYVAPYLRVNRVSATEGDEVGSGVGFSSGLFGGYSFLFAERVNLRIGAGAQYMSYVVDVAGTRVAFKTLFPALDLVVGYQF